MKTRRAGVSTTVLGAVVIVVLILGGVGGYYGGLSSGGTSTRTITSTVSGGGGAVSTTTVVSTTTAPSADLVAAAKAEGTITIYGLVDTDAFVKNIQSAFTALYPWAKVNYLGLASGDVTNKVLAEVKANAVQADLEQNLLANTFTLKNASALQPYCNPIETLEGYPPAFVDANCYYHPYSGNLAVLIYNTKLVTNPSTLPNSWADITNPIWQGKLVFDKTTRLSTAATIFYNVGKNMTYNQWITWLNSVKAQNPLMTDSVGAVYDDVSSGQGAIGIGSTDDVVAGMKAGASVSYKWIAPVPYGYFPISMVHGAPHPNMAKLFLQFITSYGGNVAMGNANRLPMLAGAAQVTLLGGLPIPLPAGIAKTTQGDAKFFANATGYLTVYKSIFG